MQRTDFSQSAICKDMASLDPSYRFGVCSVLAIQWLFYSSQGFRFEDMWFYREGVANSMLQQFVHIGMQAGRARLLKACKFAAEAPKSHAGFHSQAAFASMAGDGSGLGIYYLKLEFGECGHAIGVIAQPGNTRLFDPNHGEVRELQSASELVGELSGLLFEHYMNPPPTGFEVQRLRRAWAAAAPSGPKGPAIIGRRG